jgi:hypothetical protein
VAVGVFAGRLTARANGPKRKIPSRVVGYAALVLVVLALAFSRMV